MWLLLYELLNQIDANNEVNNDFILNASKY
jgi:hypothetical protein